MAIVGSLARCLIYFHCEVVLGFEASTVLSCILVHPITLILSFLLWGFKDRKLEDFISLSLACMSSSDDIKPKSFAEDGKEDMREDVDLVIILCAW